MVVLIFLDVIIIPTRKVYDDMLAEKQVFKKGEVCDSATIYARGGAGGLCFDSK